MAVVLNSLLSPEVLVQLRIALKKELFSPGKATAGGSAKDVKYNMQIKATHPVGAHCADLVLKALLSNVVFLKAVLPVRLSPPMFSLYEPGMAYGRHTDSALMDAGGTPMRADFSMTLFLTDPADYAGGELVFTSAEGAAHSAKLKAGSAVVYPTTTLHEVKPVTDGTRLACVLWVQSAVPEAHKRDVLLELDRAKRALDANDTNEAKERLVLARENLIRIWAKT